jgi:hypothetical protein
LGNRFPQEHLENIHVHYLENHCLTARIQLFEAKFLLQVFYGLLGDENRMTNICLCVWVCDKQQSLTTLRQFCAHSNLKKLNVVILQNSCPRLAFLQAKLHIKLCEFFSLPRDKFGSLVANLIIQKFLKFNERVLVRVFLEGYLR